MKTRTRAGLLGLALAASGGLVQAEETTTVYRQGNSTATITQSTDGEASTTRRVIRRGPNSQTIIQSQGGNSARITQSSGRSKTQRVRDAEPESQGSRVQLVVSLSADDQEDLRELALEEDTSVQALVEEAIQDLLDSQ